MTTKQLRYLLDIYKCASYTKASQNHYVSRSSLVSSIEALEKELGQPLLHRSHDGIKPTEFGLATIEAAQQILDIYDNLLEKASAVFQNDISISASHLPFIPIIFTKCFASNPDTLRISYMEKRRCQVFRDVLEDHSEIGIFSAPTNSRDSVVRFFKQNALTYGIVRTDVLSCLVGKDNPICRNHPEQISLTDLASMYRVRYRDTGPSDYANTLHIPSATLPAKGDLYIADRSSLPVLLADIPSYSPCPSYPSEYDPPNVKSLKIHDYPSTFDIIWFKKRRRTLTPFTQEFLTSLHEALGSSFDPSLF